MAQLWSLRSHTEGVQAGCPHESWMPNRRTSHPPPHSATPLQASEGTYEQPWMASFTPSLLIAVNPRSRDGKIFPNNAPNSSADAPRSATRTTGATLCVGSHACVTHTVSESAQCLGGVQLLFPLLARLPGASEPPTTSPSSPASSPSPSPPSPASPTPASGGCGNKTRAKQLLVQLLSLVSQMLTSSPYDRHFMLRRHGFAIFVFLLRQLPPSLWIVEAVTACVSITSCFASTEALHHEAVWLLFGVPRLWVYTGLEVQLRVYDVLHS
ncbi:MAG: hypothetical protein SGPRY_013264, partial [Prymnesium sp.]